MDVQLILKELHEAGVLEGHVQELKPLTGGTSSEVIAVMDGADRTLQASGRGTSLWLSRPSVCGMERFSAAQDEGILI
ncbi:MAG: hypothetical protein ACQEXV_06505 [Bacillota bacterium]